jgi:hypothetical protein
MTKLSYEKTVEELDAYVKMDVDKFFSHCRATSRAKRNPEKPYLYIPPEKLRRTVDAHQTKQRADRKKRSPHQTMTIRSLNQFRRRRRKIRWHGRVLQSSGNKHRNQCHHCWLGINMVQT